MTNINLDTVVRNWPIIAAAVVALFGYGELRYQVQDLVNDKKENELQWKRINNNSGEIARLVSKTDNITPESWEQWGRMKDAVQRHEEAVRELDRRMDAMERQR